LSSTLAFAAGQTTTTVFPDRDESALSPQLSFLYQLNGNFSIQAVVSRSFRAPTLNELYRNFRVGNVLTLANENLRAEKADNFEAGVSFNQKRTYFRGTFFWTEVGQSVANVTIGSTPSLITRQRQNAGRTRSAGVDLEAETQVKGVKLSAGYLFSESRVISFPADPALEGLFIPQVPRHQFTFQARYPVKNWHFALQGRAAGEQFDDDQNFFSLEPYFQLDGFISRKVTGSLSFFAGIENVFNSRYSVGKTPIRTVGSPLNIRTGFRWN
jgi:outer membrane receptor protein involved in Fe transport